jgi:CRP/FNR family transcriptional regulator, cyclic AMP receptor protein
MNTHDYLTKISIFNSLFFADLEVLTKLWHQRSIQKSDVIFRKGDVGSSMFIIEEGTVKITVPAGNRQKDICVAILKEGDFFGELSLIDGLPRTATATASAPCILLEMNREDFINFLLERPRIAISMLSEMGKRLQATNDLVTSLASKNINVKMDEQMSFGDKLADRVADFVGSWKFLIIFMIGVLIWCALNVVELIFSPFDPYPFVFLNLVLAVVASLQAPLIMMSQNRAQIKDRLRADLDYQVNLKSELMLQQLHTKIDEIRAAGDIVQGRKSDNRN